MDELRWGEASPKVGRVSWLQRHRRERQCGSIGLPVLLPAAECAHPCCCYPHLTSFMVLTHYRLCESPRGFSRPSAPGQSLRGSTQSVHRATLRFSASVVGRRSCGVIQPLMCRPIRSLSPLYSTHSCSDLLFLLKNPTVFNKFSPETTYCLCPDHPLSQTLSCMTHWKPWLPLYDSKLLDFLGASEVQWPLSPFHLEIIATKGKFTTHLSVPSLP